MLNSFFVVKFRILLGIVMVEAGYGMMKALNCKVRFCFEGKEMVVDWAIDVMRDAISGMCGSHESWIS